MSLKSESILRQLMNKVRDLLEETKDLVGDGRVDEKEEDDDGGSQTI